MPAVCGGAEAVEGEDTRVQAGGAARHRGGPEEQQEDAHGAGRAARAPGWSTVASISSDLI